MEIRIRPNGKKGKLSEKFLLGYLIMFGISQVFYIYTVATTPSGGEEIRVPVVAYGMAVVGVIGLLSAIGAFVTGVYSFFKEKERSLLIFLSIIFGLFALTFLLGELFLPH